MDDMTFELVVCRCTGLWRSWVLTPPAVRCRPSPMHLKLDSLRHTVEASTLMACTSCFAGHRQGCGWCAG